MRILFFLSLIIIFGSSCKSETKKSPKDILYDEVMEIHDDAMPLMGDINKQMRILKSKNNPVIDTITNLKALEHVKSLEEAEEAMMDWMAEFDQAKVKADSPEAMAYLKNEKEKISQVNSEMHTAVQQSKSYINTLDQAN